MAQGTVATFDEQRGLGTIVLEDGRELAFHCTAIADGSRTIATGAAVEVDVVPGHQGRWEADHIRPIASGRPPEGRPV